MLRANPRVLSTALFSALGLLPLACGGTFSGQQDGEGGAAGKPPGSGGTTPSGGKSGVGGMSSAGTPSAGTLSGAGTSNNAGTGSGQGSAFPCDMPMPAGAGYEQCSNGAVHRPAIKECESKLPRTAMRIAPPGDGQCVTDADCADMPHGYCTTSVPVGTKVCVYGCVRDSECGPNQICLCGDPVGECVASTCKSDADCGAGLACQRYDRSHGCDSYAFACQTPEDTCAVDNDCGEEYCDGAAGRFMCVTGGCVVGRPFLVEGAERVAPLTSRQDWRGSFELGALGGAPELRGAAALAWARVGQMEHASVAAFARFVLQLLQLGAPPQLVEDATQAMADETRHAQLAFSVACALGTSAVGPGSLDIERSLGETSLLDVVRLALREGCIGETAAALEAREAALRAESPDLARVLHAIADDESRHAELAFRFLGWALEQSPEPVRAVLERELALRAPARPVDTESDVELDLEAYGIVSGPLRGELQVTAFRQITLPCVQALLRRGAAKSAENQALSG